ncbi:MAG: WG repeat-containing protein [Aurantibacter sp.]
MKRTIVFVLLMVIPFLGTSQTLKEINKSTISGLDEVAPFSEGLAAVRKGNEWGFINKEGILVIDFRSDLHWDKGADTSKSDITGIRYPVFMEGRCMIKKTEYDIPVYGFIDTEGKTVVEPQFLNVSQFEKGYATGVLFEKVFMGENEIKLKVYDFKFHDVLVDTSGKIEEYFARRENIQMNKRRYLLPTIGSKMLTDNLVAVRTKGGNWEIRALNL